MRKKGTQHETGPNAPKERIASVKLTVGEFNELRAGSPLLKTVLVDSTAHGQESTDRG
jgi:hypothetical protein